MFEVNYVAGGRLDPPFYPTKRIPYITGLMDLVKKGENKKIEYIVPFEGEFHAINVSCSTYEIDDQWSLTVNGEIHCDGIYTKKIPEGITMMSFVPVSYGTKVEFLFENKGKYDKYVWISLQFLRDKLPDYPMITVNKEKIRLYAYDNGQEDGDVLNIYQNGNLIAENYLLRHKQGGVGVEGVNYVELTLVKGKNEIIFEGVKAGIPGSVLSGSFYVMDTDGNLLFTEDQLPSLNIPRTNIANDSDGTYADPKPRKSWVIVGDF